MRIKVIAMNEGHPGAYRAGRFFQNRDEVVLEVVDTEKGEDPPGSDRSRIGRNSFEAIKADPRLKVLSDGETSDIVSQAALDSARRMAEENAAAAAGLRVENAGLRDEIATLKAKLADRTGGAGKDGAGKDGAGESDEDDGKGRVKGGKQK